MQIIILIRSVYYTFQIFIDMDGSGLWSKKYTQKTIRAHLSIYNISMYTMYALYSNIIFSLIWFEWTGKTCAYYAVYCHSRKKYLPYSLSMFDRCYIPFRCFTLSLQLRLSCLVLPWLLLLFFRTFRSWLNSASRWMDLFCQQLLRFQSAHSTILLEKMCDFAFAFCA